MSHDLSNTLFTPSDQNDIPPKDAAILNRTTGAVVTTFAFPEAWIGDILNPSGTFAITAQDSSTDVYTGLQIYDRNTNLIATIGSGTLTGLGASGFNLIRVIAWGTGTFYVAWSGDTRPGGTTKVTTVSAAGVPGGTVWTIPNTATNNPSNLPPQMGALAVNLAGTILYYTDGFSNGTLHQTIHRYDLVNSIALTDFVVGATTDTWGDQAFVQSDDSLLVIFTTSAAYPDFVIRHYSAAAALLGTITLVANAGNFDDPLLGRDPDPLYVWAHTFEDASGNTASYYRLKISDGSTNVTFTVNTRNSGSTNIPLSCPFFLFADAPNGEIVVIKVNAVDGDTTSFDFVATALTPDTFSLMGGDTQTYTPVTPGDGYGIAETVPTGWQVSYAVSNDSPHDDISVASGETVTVTVTNSLPATRVYPLRRQRTFVIPNSENFRIFLKKLEFEVQRGVGLNDGQGSDPQLMFQLSRDGGKTWGPERSISIGKQGEYSRRAIVRQLGIARNPVGRITMSDPVFWALCAAYLEAEPGTS